MYFNDQETIQHINQAANTLTPDAPANTSGTVFPRICIVGSLVACRAILQYLLQSERTKELCAASLDINASHCTIGMRVLKHYYPSIQISGEMTCYSHQHWSICLCFRSAFIFHQSLVNMLQCNLYNKIATDAIWLQCCTLHSVYAWMYWYRSSLFK
jgi:hypothetical protein